jgi:hypothetical protein
MKISNLKKFIFVALSAAIFFIACEEEKIAVGDGYGIVSVSVCGDDGKPTDIPTTKLFITVSDDRFVLTAEDIKINAKDFSFYVIKGEFNKTGATTYELAIRPGDTGDKGKIIQIGLDPYRGFSEWNAKTVTVYGDWYFTGTENLTITGYNKSVIDPLEDQIPPEILGKPVTAIGTGVFYEKGLISIIEIPDSVKSIGDRTFAYNQLEELYIPESIISIGINAFAYNQLTSVIIPDSVTTIGSGAFDYNRLTVVSIPKDVTNIRSFTFAHNLLTEIEIKGDVISIGEDAFANNQLTEVAIPDNIVSIGNGAFGNNKLKEIDFTGKEKLVYLSGFDNNELTEIEIPNTVTAIGSGAFAYNQLIKVEIPDTVVTIGNGAFAYNQLTEIDIPDNVTTIESNAFLHNKLTEVNISGKVTEIKYRTFANNELSEITIPDSVENIGVQAFIDNLLTSITIGANVTLGSSAFGNGFENSYYSNDRKKGTYTFTGGKWEHTPIPVPIP